MQDDPSKAGTVRDPDVPRWMMEEEYGKAFDALRRANLETDRARHFHELAMMAETAAREVRIQAEEALRWKNLARCRAHDAEIAARKKPSEAAEES